MARQEDLKVGDIVRLKEDIALGRNRAIPADETGVVTRVLNTDAVTLYVVDFDQYGIRFVRRSLLTFVEHANSDFADEWDNNAVMRRMIEDPASMSAPFGVRIAANENGPNSAA